MASVWVCSMQFIWIIIIMLIVKEEMWLPISLKFHSFEFRNSFSVPNVFQSHYDHWIEFICANCHSIYSNFIWNLHMVFCFSNLIRKRILHWNFHANKQKWWHQMCIANKVQNKLAKVYNSFYIIPKINKTSSV